MKAMKAFTLLLMLLLFTVCTPSQSKENTRQIDFKNFTYRLSCGSADKETAVTVTNGEYSGLKGSIRDRVNLKITDVMFGDITGDSKDEAVVLYSCGSGASYVYIGGLIFTINKNKPALLAQITC